jgi:hypothetical protein
MEWEDVVAGQVRDSLNSTGLLSVSEFKGVTMSIARRDANDVVLCILESIDVSLEEVIYSTNMGKVSQTK